MPFDLTTAVDDGPVNPAAPKPRKFDMATAQLDAPAPLDGDKDGMQDMPSLPGEPSLPSAPQAVPERGGFLSRIGDALGRVDAVGPITGPFDPGVAEAGLSAATGAIAPFLASARGMIGGYEPSNEEISDVTYQPRSEKGQALTGLLGEAFSPLSESGADQALAGMVPEVPGGLPHGPRAPRAAVAPALSEGQSALAGIRKQGLKVTPKEASQITGDKNFFGRALQAIGGDSKVSKDISASNRPVLNKMGQKAVAAESLTEGGLKPVKDQGNAVYNEMSSLGYVTPTPELKHGINRARGSAGKSTKRNADIDKFVEGMLSEYDLPEGGQVDAGQVVTRVRELRRDAQNSMRGEGDKRPTVQQEALGEAQRTVADALDDFLEYNAATAGKTELAARYKDNRVRLAKVGTVEGSTRAGNLNAKKVFESKEKGAPLSGKLNDVATAHEYAPESTAPTGSESLMDAPGRNLSITELPVAAIQAAARHMGVNKFLQSDFYQNMLGGREGGPHLAEHDANPNAFPAPDTNWAGPPRPAAPPAPPARPSVDFAGELGLAQDGPYESLPGGVSQNVQNGQNFADALGLQLVEDAPPAGAGPNALRNGPDEINFEAVNPEDVGPYRVNTDLPLSDARPLAGVQRGAAMDTGDLSIAPDAPTGPQDRMPPKPPGKPTQGGPPREPKPKKPVPPPPAAAQPPEGLSELGAMIDQMLSMKRGQPQGPKPYYSAADSPPPLPKPFDERPAPTESVLDYQRRAGISKPAPDFANELGLAQDKGPKEAFADRYMVPGSKRLSASPDEGYIAYEPRAGRRQINDAYVKEEARGKGLGQKNLLKAARDAAEAGEALDSDVSVTPAQARAYISAKKKGLIDFDITDQQAWDDALADGTIIKAGGSPVIRNIRAVEAETVE